MIPLWVFNYLYIFEGYLTRATFIEMTCFHLEQKSNSYINGDICNRSHQSTSKLYENEPSLDSSVPQVCVRLSYKEDMHNPWRKVSFLCGSPKRFLNTSPLSPKYIFLLNKLSRLTMNHVDSFSSCGLQILKVYGDTFRCICAFISKSLV